MDKINQKQLRLSEKEKKIVSFPNSPEKKLLEIDYSKIEKFELVKNDSINIRKNATGN